MIPEPFRSRLIAARGDHAAIDAIHKEAMKAHPRLFQPFACSECVRTTQTEEGDLKCRGKTIPLNSVAHCMDYKSRRAS